jgi:putative ATP-binding cassette transporter
MNPSEDNNQKISLDRIDRHRFMRVLKALLESSVGSRAKGLALLLVVLLVGVNGLNILNSYVGRDFMTAIANRSTSGFIQQSILFISVFAVSTVVAVYYRFCEERLGLLARKWLTQRFVNSYLEHPTYYRLNDQNDGNGEISNVDQRIADDVKVFTVTILSFTLMVLNGTFTALAFSGVLWSISPVLFVVAVAYAAGGSLLAIRFGYPLVNLNYRQLDREADLRSDLIHLRENAESVALLRREGRLKARILRHLDDLTSNFHNIIVVNRNLGFFTTGYNYLVQIIPALIVAPLYINGYVEFGVITQAAMAFAHILGAFSLIVTQFQSISSFAAVVARLGSLTDAIEKAQSSAATSIVSTENNNNGVAYHDLTLWQHSTGLALINHLSLTIPYGTRVLILGPDDAAKVALFRATAGIWDAGEGEIVRPDFDTILFLPERPYLPPGTLRELLVRTGREARVADQTLRDVLQHLCVESVIERAAGFDQEQQWDVLLSLTEQKILALARLVLAEPRFVFMDRINTALNREDVERLLTILNERLITYINVGSCRNGRRDTDDRLDDYDAILEISGTGEWRWLLLSNLDEEQKSRLIGCSITLSEPSIPPAQA